MIKNGPFGLTSNMLKIIAMIAMTLDHVGFVLLDNYTPFRIIGRLAFPIFAYLLAEGCFYTKNKKRHLLEVFILGVLCQIVYFFVKKDLYLGVLLTFSLSISEIYLLQIAKRNRKLFYLPFLGLLVIYFLCEGLPALFPGAKLHFDYGFAGATLPVLISVFEDRRLKLAAMAAGLVLLTVSSTFSLQWWCIFSLFPIALYNGKRGKYKLKYTFYIFYPLHLGVIYGIDYMLSLM